MAARVPVIAIPECSKLPDYEQSVRNAGGEPRVVRAGVDSPEDVVRGADGILLPGGGDVDPTIYGEAAHPTFGAAEPGRDAFELELARRALDADLPMLAICRGIQVLNVARGGTLIQDIPDQVATGLNHQIKEPSASIAHPIAVTAGTLLERIVGDRLEAQSCDVNSRHHQAVGTLGSGLVVSATAPDGIVEAVEDPTRRFCVGVQWHPENFWRTGEFQPLFDAFVSASARSRTP